MEIEKLLKDSWEIFRKNWVVYVVGTFIAVFGSILVITLPPLYYGLTYIAAKGARGDTVEITDLFIGFKPNNFIQSWILLLAIAVPFVVIMFMAAKYIGLGVFIVEIILLIAMFIFFVYTMPLMVVKKRDAIPAIMESTKIAMFNLPNTIIIAVIVAVFNWIASLTVIGVLVTTPISEILVILALQSLIGDDLKIQEMN